jgi:hypothetical protein
MILVRCPSCGIHVRPDSSRCPFCASPERSYKAALALSAGAVTFMAGIGCAYGSVTGPVPCDDACAVCCPPDAGGDAADDHHPAKSKVRDASFDSPSQDAPTGGSIGDTSISDGPSEDASGQ